LGDAQQKHDKIVPKCVAKWGELYNFESSDWKTIYKIPFNACKETELQSFQYKIIQRIIACRHWLYNLKVIDSPNCLHCEQDDNIQHFFIHCTLCEPFWKSFVTWWTNLIKQEFPWDDRIVLFGIPSYAPLAQLCNFCLIFAKWHIYRTKIGVSSSNTPTLYGYLKALKEKVELEYVYYKSKNKMDMFEKKWGFLHENL